MKEILPEPIRKRIDKTAHYSVIYSGLQREWPEMAKAYSKGYLADLGLVDHEGFKKIFTYGDKVKQIMLTICGQLQL